MCDLDFLALSTPLWNCLVFFVLFVCQLGMSQETSHVDVTVVYDWCLCQEFKIATLFLYTPLRFLSWFSLLLIVPFVLMIMEVCRGDKVSRKIMYFSQHCSSLLSLDEREPYGIFHKICLGAF